MGLVLRFFGCLLFTIGICKPVRAFSVESTADSIPYTHFLTIRHDNDCMNLIGALTDRYYTAGIFADYAFVTKKRNLLDYLLPAFRHSDRQVDHVGAGVLLYTPRHIKFNTVQYGDYPYSGTIYLDLARDQALGKKTIFRSELWLGILGPAAQGRSIQTFIHRILDFDIPRGWSNQLPDYPVINYNFYFETALFQTGDYFHVNGTTGIRVGSLLDDARGGLSFILSNDKGDYFPGVTGISARACRHHIYIQWQPGLRYSAYNGILRGGLGISDKYYTIPSAGIERLLFESRAAAGISLNRLLIEYAEVYSTREFNTVVSHTYGSVAISYSF